jgi:hypothetical protein
VNGLFNAYVVCVHPAFRSGELSAAGDPYGGYTGGDAVMLDYLKRNPAMAQKAAGAVATFAASNPDVAMNIASAAAANRAGGGGGGGGGDVESGEGGRAGANPWA